MNFLILDLNGVINAQNAYSLNKLIFEFNIKIVASSVYRYEQYKGTLKKCEKLYKKSGIRGEICDLLPTDSCDKRENIRRYVEMERININSLIILDDIILPEVFFPFIGNLSSRNTSDINKIYYVLKRKIVKQLNNSKEFEKDLSALIDSKFF